MVSLRCFVGQFFIVGFHGTQVNEKIKNLIINYHVGGIILFSRNIINANQLRKLTNDLQHIARNAGYKRPLLICLDQENGIVRRIVNGVSVLPGEMAITATQDSENIKRVYEVTARELKELGVNWDLAPVADINSNPQNPVIGVRSFGNKINQVSQAVAYATQSLQKNEIISCLKHFPGHGNTKTDSHTQLPIINESLDRLKEQDILPFKAGIEAKAESIMVAHILFKRVDSIYPASLSKKIIKNILREKIKYNGLIVTDDLEMKAVADKYGVSQAAILAFKAGVDMVMVAHDYKLQLSAINAVAENIKSKGLKKEDLKYSLQRINLLKDKYATFASNFQETDFIEMVKKDKKIAQKIYQESVTEVQHKSLLMRPKKIYVINFGFLNDTQVVDRKQKEDLISKELIMHGIISISITNSFEEKISHLTSDDVVIIGTKNIKTILDTQVNIVKQVLTRTNNVVVIALQNPYDFLYLPSSKYEKIAIYEYMPETISVAISAFLESKKLTGVLPVDLEKREQ